MFWNYFHNRFAKLVQKGTTDEVFQLMDSDYKFSKKAQEALILRKNEAEIIGYFIRKRVLSDENQVLLIEQMPSEIFDLIEHQSVCDKAAEMIVQNGNSDNIKRLLHNQKVPENVQNAVMKRDIEAEIKHLLIFQRDISIGVIKMVAERGRLDEAKTLMDNHRVFDIIDLRSQTATTLLQLKNRIEIKRNAEIVNKGNSQEILSMLKSLKNRYGAPILDEESRDKIILRGNSEEIIAYLDSGFLPSEKAIVYLIDNGFYQLAARCLNIDCGGYMPFTEKIIATVLEKGDELLVFALLRHSNQLSHLLKQVKKQEWFEKQIIARGSKDEIACMARIYKVSKYTVNEILHRNIGQEIKALIDGNNISDAYIYNLIDLKRYDLLENYARCVQNNPTLYFLIKCLKRNT